MDGEVIAELVASCELVSGVHEFELRLTGGLIDGLDNRNKK